jgi:hypothetical protein
MIVRRGLRPPRHSRESGKGSQTRRIAFGVPNPAAPRLSRTPACAGVTEADALTGHSIRRPRAIGYGIA